MINSRTDYKKLGAILWLVGTSIGAMIGLVSATEHYLGLHSSQGKIEHLIMGTLSVVGSVASIMGASFLLTSFALPSPQPGEDHIKLSYKRVFWLVVIVISLLMTSLYTFSYLLLIGHEQNVILD